MTPIPFSTKNPVLHQNEAPTAIMSLHFPKCNGGHTLNQSILGGETAELPGEREKTERKNTLKACIPYLVPAQLSKQINVCHMTCSRLFPRVREMQRVLVTALETRVDTSKMIPTEVFVYKIIRSMH